jgi:hypothetical protein
VTNPTPSFDFIECIRIADEHAGKQAVSLPPLTFTLPLVLPQTRSDDIERTLAASSTK